MQPIQPTNCASLTLSSMLRYLRKLAVFLGLLGLCGVSVFAQAPTITTQPASAQKVQGDNHTFTVAGANFSGSTIQWHLNGAAIPGANAASLALYNLGWTNAGNYQVIITNNSGAVTSAVAVLTVTPVSGVFFDFDTAGQLVNNFNSRGTIYSLSENYFYGSAIWGEASDHGVNNSGSVAALTTTNINTLTCWRQPFNFSPTGTVLNASIMFKYETPTVPAMDRHILYLGFMSATNQDPNISLSSTNAAYPGTGPGSGPAGPHWFAVRLNTLATNSPTTNAELFFEYKEAFLNIGVKKASIYGALTNGLWYRLNLTMTNNKASTA